MSVSTGRRCRRAFGAPRHQAPRDRQPFRRAKTLGGALGVTVLGAVVPGAGYLWTGRRLRYAVLGSSSPGWPSWGTTPRTGTSSSTWPSTRPAAGGRRGAGRGVRRLGVHRRDDLRDGATAGHAPPGEHARRDRRHLAVRAGRHPAVQSVRLANTQAHFVAPSSGRADRDRPDQHHRGRPWGGATASTCCCSAGTGGGAHGDPHRLGDPAERGHPHRQGGDVQPAAQHDERPVPGTARCEGVPGRVPHQRPQRGRRQLDAQRGLQPGARALPHILGTRRTGRRRDQQAVAGSLNTRGLLRADQPARLPGSSSTPSAGSPSTSTTDRHQRQHRRGDPADRLSQPGADQHLDGFHALWYSRGRWGRTTTSGCCASAAWSTIIEEADPLNVLRRYQALAKSGEILRPTCRAS